MKNVDIIRAWKDKSYRESLTQEQLAQVPANPAGVLSEEAQSMVTGGKNGRFSGGSSERGPEYNDECYPS